MESQIKWNEQEVLKLEKAVNDFNSKLAKLQKQENKLYLPTKLNLKDVKENIVTRKELNRKVDSLRRFMKKGAESVYITQAGEAMTMWEREELGRQSRIGQIRLKKEYASLGIPKKRAAICKASDG